MPVKIFSKEVAEKYDALVSRLFEGLEIEGKKENDFRIIEKPNPHIIPEGSHIYNSNGLDRLGTITVNGGVLTSADSVYPSSAMSVKVTGGSSAHSASITGSFTWNEDLQGYRNPTNASGYYSLVTTDDFGDTVTLFSYHNDVKQPIRFEYLVKQ